MFYINDYCAAESERYSHNDIINSIFTRDDFKIELSDEGDGIECVFQSFQSIAKICIERLEIFGLTKIRIESELISLINRISEDGYEFENHKQINCNYYFELIKNIIYNNIPIENGNFFSNNFNEHLIGSYCQIGRGSNLESYQNYKCWLFSLLSVVSENTIIRYDFLDQYINLEAIIESQRIIILTEGKTDTEFIIAGFELFYPHLLPFYQFLDYTEKPNGSASVLVDRIKTFVGTKINDKIIGLFDNDGAGKREMKRINKVEKNHLNIKLLQYPSISICDNYPVKNTTGIQYMNVNGLACSIEMYLGLDILTNVDGELRPVILTEKEHGSLSIADKSCVQKMFRIKIANAKELTQINKENWVDMIAILNVIKHAWD